MKNTIKLIVPLILGLAAGAFNFMALQSSVQEITFIKASQDIQIGEPFTTASVEALTILKQHSEGLSDTAILYEDLGLLSGQVATRTIRAGDVILYRDTEGLEGEIYDFRKGDLAALPVSLNGIATLPKMRVGDYVELKIPVKHGDATAESEWIGPFRLVSVGNNISNQAGISESGRISVAYDSKNKLMLDKLENFIDRSQSTKGARLIGIKLNIR